MGYTIEIHQLRERGFKIAQISKRFKISRKTVYKYLEMSFEEALSEFSCSLK
ncbi:helix-turn-helix domain-containing protein [Lysinibacillus sp. 38-6]|uniref:helix-turn-helix domain-containing protein n=1 Tax=Lysinibacillus sp. 38-6 TaxID=3385991 RepID=UPI0039088EC7